MSAAAMYGCAGCDWLIGDKMDGRAFICVGGSACYDGHYGTGVALIVCFDWATVGYLDHAWGFFWVVLWLDSRLIVCGESAAMMDRATFSSLGPFSAAHIYTNGSTEASGSVYRCINDTSTIGPCDNEK